MFDSAIGKAGNERKLASILEIPKSSLNFYKLGKRNMTESRLKIICNFLDVPSVVFEKNVLSRIPENWGKVKGGRNSVKLKIRKGTFKSDMENLKRISSKRMKQWHKEAKAKDPERYYKLQYKRFKKIVNKPFLRTKAGIKVRNKYEKEVVDFLFDKGFRFKYEPYLNINKKAYFPDLIVFDKYILEITAWKHPDSDKIKYLKRKIRDYRKAGYVVYFYIPTLYRNFYKEIDDFVISDLSKFSYLLSR